MKESENGNGFGESSSLSVAVLDGELSDSESSYSTVSEDFCSLDASISLIKKDVNRGLCCSFSKLMVGVFNICTP